MHFAYFYTLKEKCMVSIKSSFYFIRIICGIILFCSLGEAFAEVQELSQEQKIEILQKIISILDQKDLPDEKEGRINFANAPGVEAAFLRTYFLEYEHSHKAVNRMQADEEQSKRREILKAVLVDISKETKFSLEYLSSLIMEGRNLSKDIFWDESESMKKYQQETQAIKQQIENLTCPENIKNLMRFVGSQNFVYGPRFFYTNRSNKVTLNPGITFKNGKYDFGLSSGSFQKSLPLLELIDPNVKALKKHLNVQSVIIYQSKIVRVFLDDKTEIPARDVPGSVYSFDGTKWDKKYTTYYNNIFGECFK